MGRRYELWLGCILWWELLLLLLLLRTGESRRRIPLWTGLCGELNRPLETITQNMVGRVNYFVLWGFFSNVDQLTAKRGPDPGNDGRIGDIIYKHKFPRAPHYAVHY